MTLYCTIQDLIDRVGEDELIELTDRSNVGELDAAVINGAIADASSLMDGYIATRYTVPLAVDFPVMLTRLCCNIARFNLYDTHPTENVKQQFDATMKVLGQISKGHITLSLNSGNEKPAQGDAVQMQTNPAVFSRKQDGFL